LIKENSLSLFSKNNETMKKISLLLATALAMAACNNGSNADKATTTDTQTVQKAEGAAYAVDSTTTVIWTGTKPTGKHEGTFKVTEGTLFVKDNTLVAGSFTIDINSLTDNDMAADAENKAKLEGHLKSPDFFDAAKFPVAKFEITSIEPFVADSNNKEVKLKDATHLIKGNLTLKDSTKNISFPAKVTIGANTVATTADFTIDRTVWGMNYKGPNNPQDWVISKEVNIKFSIAASKK
jgi:polyisoprenoid-binding protein YceI